MRTTNNKQQPGTRSPEGEGRGAGIAPTRTGQEIATHAVLQYANWSAMIKEASKQIGTHLSKCPGYLGTLHKWSHQHPAEGSDDKTHLSAYFDMSKGGWSRADVEQMRQRMEACPYCAFAHTAVQDRKAYRQKLGAAKREIARAAKMLLAEVNAPDPDAQARALYLAAQTDLFEHQGGASA